MYAKIVTLLALLVGSLSGVTATSQSVKGDHLTHAEKLVESVRLYLSQDTAQEVTLHPEGDDPSRPEQTPVNEPVIEPMSGCHTIDGSINGEVMDFANQLALPYESVLNWYCTGYSFGTIQIVYDMSVMAGVSIDQIYDMRVVEGSTWNQVIQDLGITFSRSEELTLLDEPRPSRSDK